MASSDDDETELPPAFSSLQDDSIQVEDIVWAKYNKYYWPAVIRNVYPRLRKVSVMFVDSPKRCIRIPLRHAIPYTSSKGQELQDQFSPQKMPESDLLRETVSRVDDYMCKRVLKGDAVSPMKYFQYPFYVWSANSSTNGESEETRNSNDSSLEMSDSEESDVQEIATNLMYANQEKDPRIDRLIAIIRTDECTNYLNKILNAEVECDRHRKFLSVTPSVRRQLKLESGFGPIQDERQVMELFDYMIPLLKHSTRDVAYFDKSTYLFEVWIPEAIIWSLSKEFEMPLEEAQELFYQEKLCQNKEN